MAVAGTPKVRLVLSTERCLGRKYLLLLEDEDPDLLITPSGLPWKSQPCLSWSEHTRRQRAKEFGKWTFKFADSQLQNYKIEYRRVSGMGLRDNR